MTTMRERGFAMRTRITFLAGFAAGYVAGARAGRERYEQIVKLSRKAAESPAVRKATQAAGDKATGLTKAAGQKAADSMPKIAETAKNSASKVRRQRSRNSGGDDDNTTANGTRPGD